MTDRGTPVSGRTNDQTVCSSFNRVDINRWALSSGGNSVSRNRFIRSLSSSNTMTGLLSKSFSCTQMSPQNIRYFKTRERVKGRFPEKRLIQQRFHDIRMTQSSETEYDPWFFFLPEWYLGPWGTRQLFVARWGFEDSEGCHLRPRRLASYSGRLWLASWW